MKTLEDAKSNAEKICDGKKIFMKKSDAEKFRDHHIFSNSQYIYECPVCKGYHMTKKKKVIFNGKLFLNEFSTNKMKGKHK